MRLIDADVFAKKAYDVAYPVVHGWNDHERGLTLFGIAQLLDEMQPVDAVPVRHGHWVGIDDEPCEVFECDICGYIYETDSRLYNYCPNCGAKMDKRKEE